MHGSVVLWVQGFRATGALKMASATCAVPLKAAQARISSASAPG